MRQILSISAVFWIALPVHAGQWLLEKAKVSYLVSHPLHKIEATSAGAKGKGVCDKSGCEFLVAAPVKSFDSQNTNRDAHVQQVVGAGLHPLVSVRIKSKTADFTDKTPMTASVEMNGKTVGREIEVLVGKSSGVTTAKGRLNLKLSEFGIELPSLLGVSVKDEFVVDFDSQWRD